MIHLKKKRIFKLILACLALYLLWSVYFYLRYPALDLSQPESDPKELVGIYHVHSTLSDGHKTPEDVARVAAGQNLAFVILTDHGNPNFASLDSQGWQSGVLLLAGSELSVNRGHLVGIGFSIPPKPFSQTAELAAQQITQAQGFTVIAHPYSEVHWTWGEYAGYSGIEVLSADTILRKNFARVLPILPLILFKPRIPAVRLLHNPGKNLRKWDELNLRHTVYGFYSCDAHIWYGPLFSSLRLHVLLNKTLPPDFNEAQEHVYTALKRGRFFNAVDAAAPSRGFRFRGEGAEGPVEMGSVTGQLPLQLQAESPPGFASEICLIQDGRTIERTSANALVFNATQPGTYRIEVYLKEVSPLAPDCPWILSNPIFIRKKQP